MAEVHAVKNLDTLKLITHLLSIRYSQQMADVWDVGLNLALRISDLLSIKFDQIVDDRLVLREAKTGKLASIVLNQKVQRKISAPNILVTLFCFNPIVMLKPKTVSHVH